MTMRRSKPRPNWECPHDNCGDCIRLTRVSDSQTAILGWTGPCGKPVYSGDYFHIGNTWRGSWMMPCDQFVGRWK
jgi:hypothetical protein